MNDSLERDHQRVKKRFKTMRGLKSPDTGKVVLKGMESVDELYKQGVTVKDMEQKVYEMVKAA